MIWPLNLLMRDKIKATEEVPPFKGVSFSKDGVLWHYTPTSDITAHEIALLLPLFCNPYGYYNRWAYIEHHNLTKFFKEDTDGISGSNQT